jgi:hypothetical protein
MLLLDIQDEPESKMIFALIAVPNLKGLEENALYVIIKI